MSVRNRRRRPKRSRVGRVSFYLHHGGWHVYYRDGVRQVRRRIADNEIDAERVAAQINAQLAAQTPTLLAFKPITVADLRHRFLEHHEHVVRSSLATVRRYRTATLHLENFAKGQSANLKAHELRPQPFAIYLRGLMVAPNGHPNSRCRTLRDKGVQYILECCRSMFTFANRMRHLPPYSPNPFSDLQIDHLRIDDAKPIFVFDADSEFAFFKAAFHDWSFACHFTLAKTGMRPGELVHLMIEEIDLDGGWLHVRGKPLLGWRVKTGRDRDIPIGEELVAVLRRVIAERKSGLVFLRPKFTHCTAQFSLKSLHRIFQDRVNLAADEYGRSPNRSEQACIARGVWRDAGIIKVDAIRTSFIRIMKRIGHGEATCPKSWRHTFATLLQDAGVDPLIRQITLGHKPAGATNAALGMTSIYTHTRPETHRKEVLRALNLWPHSLQLAQHWANGGV